MRIKFLSLDLGNKIVIRNNHRYSEGEVALFQDDIAQKYINEKIAELFNYPITDDEIRRLYKDYIETFDFKRKVELLLYSYSKSVNKALLEDGTFIEFRLTPEDSNNRLYYNLQLIEFYKNKFQDCSIEGLKIIFNKKQINSPDQNKLIDSELNRIKMIVNNDNSKGIVFWYNETINGNIPKDDDDYDTFLSKPIQFGIKIFLRGMALAEYEAYLGNIRENLWTGEYQRKDSITTLSELFTSSSEFNKIMAILVIKKLCQEGTFIWTDEKKGSLKMLASIIKHLHSKGYYKRRPTNNEIQSIAKNTFNIDIGIDTIKRAKNDSFDFNFLPAKSEN